MSRSNAPKRNRTAAGFTLLEMMVSVTISMVIFLAVLGAYYYLARNLTRVANTQSLEVATRRATYLFTRDVSTAKQITASATQITLSVPVPPGYKTVVYNYVVTNGVGVLTRTATPASAAEDVTDSSLPQAQILSGLTAFNFNFYGADGSAADHARQSHQGRRVRLLDDNRLCRQRDPVDLFSGVAAGSLCEQALFGMRLLFSVREKPGVPLYWLHCALPRYWRWRLAAMRRCAI